MASIIPALLLTILTILLLLPCANCSAVVQQLIYGHPFLFMFSLDEDAIISPSKIVATQRALNSSDNSLSPPPTIGETHLLHFSPALATPLEVEVIGRRIPGIHSCLWPT